MKNKIYILTRQENDYNQHGEYYETYFIGKPTVKQIINWTGHDEEYAKWVLNGGGRKDDEDVWYNLRE